MSVWEFSQRGNFDMNEENYKREHVDMVAQLFSNSVSVQFLLPNVYSKAHGLVFFVEISLKV